MDPRRPDILDVLSHDAGASPALEDSQRSVDYSGLASRVGSISALLVERGVRPGDRVVVSLPNSASSVEAFLASAAVGAIWVGVNPAAPQAERARQAELVSPKVVIGTADAYLPRGAESIDVPDTCEPLTATPDAQRALLPRPDVEMACAIAFSSGTTGTPKAIVHSRAGLSLAAAALAATVRHGDRVGVTLPCSILNVMIVGPCASLLAGATTVLLDRFTARDVAAACHERRLTLVRALVPATVYDMVHDSELSPESLSSLRQAGTGAAGLAESLRGAFEEKFGIRLSGSYGLSEAPAALCCEDTDRPRRAGASGTPLAHVEISIRDPAGVPLPSGVTGEIWVGPARAGPWAHQYRGALGRWLDGELAPEPSDGPDHGESGLATGDIGFTDDEGSLHVVGRAADVITRGGVTVTATELEAIIGAFVGVREVAVIGRPHDRLGEQIIAFVESQAGLTLDPAVVRREAATVLSHGKVPDQVILLDALPRNVMGKVARAELLAMAQDSLRE
jgi:malonyl-CoA/methylmalonyl-CoA synthetase